MTDITELAPAMKSAAEKASGGDWVKESGDGWEAVCSNDDQANSGFIIAHFVGPEAAANREFAQAASPANILALIEALEAKVAECQRMHDELRGATALATLMKIDARELVREAEAKDARIAELQESNAQVINSRDHYKHISEELMRRIHELQSRAEAAEVLAKSHKSLRDSMAAIHNTIRGDGAYVSLSVLLSASRRAYDESAQAAKLDIQIQGGE